MKLHDFDVNSLIQMLKSFNFTVTRLCFSDLNRGREDRYTLYVMLQSNVMSQVVSMVYDNVSCGVVWCGVV